MQHWIEFNGNNAQLLAVSQEAVYAETAEKAAAEAQQKRLSAGESPANVFGPKAEHVVLRNVTKVQTTTADDDITFDVEGGKDTKTQSITIDDAGIRDSVFAAIGQATQGKFSHHEDQYTRPRAAFASAMTLSLLAMGTAIAVRAAIAIQAADEVVVEGRRKGIKKLVVWVLETLGPWGCGLIGTAMCLLALFVLVQRIKSPPVVQILQAKPYVPQSTIVTVFKYGLLAAIWVLFAPGVFLG